MEVGGRGRVYTYRYTVTTRMTPALKVGSDESHFNVSLIVRDKVTRPCPQTTTFEEKGEPKRYRTEVLPLTSLCRLTARPNRLSLSLSVCYYLLPVFGIFNVRILMLTPDACDCIHGLYEQRTRVYNNNNNNKWTLGERKTFLAASGFEPVSVLRVAFQSRALPTAPLGTHVERS